MAAAIHRRHPHSLRLRDGRVLALPAVMGILNVTPDSFSDGGRYCDLGRAVAHALGMEAEGAAIIDVGGESTRPGARAVPVEIEMARVLPVLRELRRKLRIPVSIDTRNAATARAALDEGVAVINDVGGLRYDPDMLAVAADSGAAVVIMHMRGTPETMTRHARYRDVVSEVRAFLRQRADAAIRAGVRRSRIIVDPGIGFAKTARHNLELIRDLPRLCELGYPVLVGASRKAFVRRISGPGEKGILFGTAAVNAIAVAAGASIIRAHDVAAAVAAMRIGAAMAAIRDDA